MEGFVETECSEAAELLCEHGMLRLVADAVLHAAQATVPDIAALACGETTYDIGCMLA